MKQRKIRMHKCKIKIGDQDIENMQDKLQYECREEDTASAVRLQYETP